MTDDDINDKKYADPTNRVICILDRNDAAVSAKNALIEFGFEDDQIKILQGESAADEVDTSATWFADTDVEMRRFERELRSGNTVLAVPVKDCGCREQVHEILKRFDARRITHFGEWVTEVMK